ncbi:MAG TPA: hypothetical protein PLT26_07685 [Anaerolineaceae bacterium]|nr:hypothetical protein [Anaerolineaceae bacterium]HQH85544.1 hypothetical protein [Anaerolineaceae bacterium]
MNLIEFLRVAKIEDLGLPEHIIQQLRNQNITEFLRLYSSVQAYRTFGKSSIEGLTDEEMQILDQKFTDLFISNGLIKPQNTSARAAGGAVTSMPTTASRTNRANNSGSLTTTHSHSTQKQQIGGRETMPPLSRPASPRSLSTPSSPLSIWEDRLMPQLRKAELIGEIPISQEDLKEISTHFNSLFHNRSNENALGYIEQYLPATFLVFMVGYGVHGYDNGDFWSTYEAVLSCSVDSTKFGGLFEKLIKRFGKKSFPDLQERARRYVDPILAHGGIPVYCLKDFFSNIVLNCTNHPQLSALEGEELVEEVLKHATYTSNTDKPVLNFLEYGGITAANLLDRARKMLITWQQKQTLLSPEDAGLPVHITYFFAEWVQKNASLLVERGTKNRFKRPVLCLDPWGLGIFLEFPSQPVSMFNMSDLYWKVDAQDLHEEIKARTQRRGDQIETREITLRLSKVPEGIWVQFCQGENNVDWHINGYSTDHLILAFDPLTGHVQNHIMARETWLLYPSQFSLSILSGEGELLEVLPDLPGEWSKFRLECWDLSQTIRLGLVQQGEVFRDIYVRSHEKIEPPSFEGGNLLLTDIEEYPTPVYSGTPPKLRIPLGRIEDIRTELGRWQLQISNVGLADPEALKQIILADLVDSDYELIGNTIIIDLAAPDLLTSKPAGVYQIAIKGPLGRDTSLNMQILPQCEVSGLKDLYIPSRDHGPEPVSFSIQTSLLTGVDSINGADGVRIEIQKPGLHQVLVPADISSVGLLLRRETLKHQFIQTPIYLRVKRLRWRIVRDNGQVENWQQKHSTISLMEILQDESPILVVDLPGNNNGDLQLSLELLDIQGKAIQRLKPAVRSTKYMSRFWRFDLSQIKQSMEVSDSPIFRVELVGTRNSADANVFNLPVLVMTRELELMQIQTEIYSSSDQHHVLVTWKEKRHVKARALILWSIFRPWQPPIVINIPDSACGEYEFQISRKDHAEGIYRMQMVVIDPWAPSPPPTLPPTASKGIVYDLELSPPSDRLKQLEREILSATYRQVTQFSNRIEISLIRQYLSEVGASNNDLIACCRNLAPATSREILTLSSILSQLNLPNLNQDFGEQIIQPEILSRLYQSMIASEITLSEFLSVIKFAPHSKDWPSKSCEILANLEDPKIRFRALTQLVTKDIGKAVERIVKLSKQSSLSLEDAVGLLFEEKHLAIEQLKRMADDPIAEQLLDLLNRFNLYSGLPVVRIGSWVLTNAGWGRINEILDPDTRISVDNFLEGDGKYILSVSLHIYESQGLTGEKALINMSTNEIVFPRANRVFLCPYCQSFATAKVEIFKNHLLMTHGNALPYPGEPSNVVRLSSIQFNMNPQPSKRDQ